MIRHTFHVMRARYRKGLLLILTIPILDAGAQHEIIARAPRNVSGIEKRELSQAFSRKAERDRRAARYAASKQGWSYRGVTNGMYFELEAIRDGKVYMDASDNRDAGITAASDQIQGLPFELTGAGIPVGVWEAGGIVMSNHQELVGRVLQLDTVSLSSHAAHVAGTIAAYGISNRAKGMAPGSILVALDSAGDEAEMIYAGRSDPAETNVIQISNHSYSSNSGWEDSFNPDRWYGTWPASESDNFGLYESQTREWDVIAYAAPYYLIFKSAGNNRNDSAPSDGATFQYYNGGWISVTYNHTIHPPDDGWDNGGYDTITPKSCAKNIMTVGATTDAETGGGPRTVSLASMTDYSGWGPTDDGRIKPDMVANGSSLYSCDDDFSQDYTTKSGTSMSTPSAAGSAALLLELQGYLSKDYLLSSTLKGLLLHTADDLGRTGPDYEYGWGLLNVRTAAEHMLLNAHNPNGNHIVEDTITDASRTNTYTINWQSNGVIKATLCWTDPPGVSRSGVDNTNLCLVNDLDLRLIAPDSTTYYPWVLDPFNPTNPTQAGVNFRDNVEQVCITNPSGTGVWSIVVSSDEPLTDGVQTYSLLITGNDNSTGDHVDLVSHSKTGGGDILVWGSLTGKTYHVFHATNLWNPSPFSAPVATVPGEYLTTRLTHVPPSSDSGFYYVTEE